MSMRLIFILILACKMFITFSANAAFQLPEGPVKLCFIGDTGTAYDVQFRVAELLAQEGCYSVHVLGDVIYPNGIKSSKDPLIQKKFLDPYRPVMDNAPNPIFYLIMGNHDHRGSTMPWTVLAKEHKSIYFPKLYYTLSSSGLCLVHLDTDIYKKFNLWGEAIKQTLWLREEKKKLKECSIKIALTHHPYESRGKYHGPATGLVRYFLEQQVIGSFDFLISGHEHILSDEGQVKGTHLFISGAGGKPDKGEESGYLVFEFLIQSGKANFQQAYFKKAGVSKTDTR
jgi:tartrate-resistant acid phosphatase type 5